MPPGGSLVSRNLNGTKPEPIEILDFSLDKNLQDIEDFSSILNKIFCPILVLIYMSEINDEREKIQRTQCHLLAAAT